MLYVVWQWISNLSHALSHMYSHTKLLIVKYTLCFMECLQFFWKGGKNRIKCMRKQEVGLPLKKHLTAFTVERKYNIPEIIIWIGQLLKNTKLQVMSTSVLQAKFSKALEWTRGLAMCPRNWFNHNSLASKD